MRKKAAKQANARRGPGLRPAARYLSTSLTSDTPKRTLFRNAHHNKVTVHDDQGPVSCCIIPAASMTPQCSISAPASTRK
jgi:hypothetical protein